MLCLASLLVWKSVYATRGRPNGGKMAKKRQPRQLRISCFACLPCPALTQCNFFLLRVDHAPQDLKGSTLHGDSSGTSPTEPHPSQPSKRPLFHVGPAGTDWKPSFVRFSLSYPKGLSKTRTDVTHASHPTHPVDGLAGARFCLDAKPSPTIRHPPCRCVRQGEWAKKRRNWNQFISLPANPVVPFLSVGVPPLACHHPSRSARLTSQAHGSSLLTVK